LPAIHRQRRAGNVTDLLGAQESDAASDLFGRAQPADGDLGGDSGEHLGRHRADHVGVGIAWRNRVHRHPAARASSASASGLASIAAAVVIGLEWPVNALWILGLVLSVDLVIQGVALLAAGFSIRSPRTA
jgi:hypothetical protein